MSDSEERADRLASDAHAILVHLPPGEVRDEEPLALRSVRDRLLVFRRVSHDVEDVFSLERPPGDDETAVMRLRSWAHDPPVIVVTYFRQGEAILGVMLPHTSPKHG
ncbi:MAG: hypothetical protein J2O39_03105 [Acidimicrobiales bacterium]|nr:hypothetical protein [Acidimicrobiales bacterium]